MLFRLTITKYLLFFTTAVCGDQCKLSIPNCLKSTFPHKLNKSKNKFTTNCEGYHLSFLSFIAVLIWSSVACFVGRNVSFVAAEQIFITSALCRWVYTSYCSTFRGVHTAHSKHGPNRSLPGPRSGTLKQGPALWQEVILHPLHQESLTLYAVAEKRVGLQVSQELHMEGKQGKNAHINTQYHVTDTGETHAREP